ncbi:MAG: hypothetical protein LLG01_04265 [Planctomycetaceae bacterium]|nr:hypothetical protein [Planctomycetaceae bacterium]
MWQDLAIGAVLCLLAAAAIYRICLAAKGKGGCGCERHVFPREIPDPKSQDPGNETNPKTKKELPG